MIDILVPDNLLFEVAVSAGLLAYVFAVVHGTKYVYNYLRAKGSRHNVAVYYNRKLIHVFAGGVVALLVPMLFSSPLMPFIIAMIMAVSTWLPHKKGQLMEWFQVKDNMFEVNFCLMWGISMMLAWLLLGDPLYALIPILFMAFGDAATGFTRNLLFKRRTKSWWGNLAMFVVCIPITYWFLGIWGIPLAAIASFVEHFEAGPIDDNVLISLVALAGVVVIKYLGVL